MLLVFACGSSDVIPDTAFDGSRLDAAFDTAALDASASDARADGADVELDAGRIDSSADSGLEDAEVDTGLLDGGVDPTTRSKAEVIELYRSELEPTEFRDPEWTGSLATCDAGSLPARVLALALRRINYFRSMAGAPPVAAFNPVRVSRAQEISLIAHRNVDDPDLVANPWSIHNPHSDWICYSDEGRLGGMQSSLAWYIFSASSTISSWMRDPGAGNENAGHRRALLDVRSPDMGFGAVAEGVDAWWEREGAAALAVVPDADERPDAMVGWPPPGFVPAELAFPRWSMVNWAARQLGMSTVTMTDAAGGRVELAQVSNPSKNIYTVWEPDIAPEDGDTFHVHIEGYTVGGMPRTYEYSVIRGGGDAVAEAHRGPRSRSAFEVRVGAPRAGAASSTVCQVIMTVGMARRLSSYSDGRHMEFPLAHQRVAGSFGPRLEYSLSRRERRCGRHIQGRESKAAFLGHILSARGQRVNSKGS